MSLRNRLRALLITAVTASLVGGLLLSVPASAATPSKPDDTALARERQAATDGLTRSRAVFARSSYLCYGYQACSAAGMSAAGYASVNNQMFWRMYSGHNCTNYAAYRMVRSGLPNSRPWSGGGNATYWGTSNPKITNNVPVVGAVAWWRANTGPAGSAGHVAYVEKVVSADQIIVSQDSWGGDFSWAVITKASGNWPSGFVHFNDVKLVNKAIPVISGVAKVGAKLKATAGTWSPTDAKISYQWYAGGVAIPRATASTLTVAGTALGKWVQVRTTATKAGYPAKMVGSVSTAPVLPGVIASRTAPVLSGVVQVDRTLTLTPGTWNVTPDRTTVQWYAGGRPIPGAVGTTLELTPELAGLAISAKVTASRASYTPVTAQTTATVPVALGIIGVGRGPSVTGTAKPGRILTLDPGLYRPADGATSIQWLRSGRPIPGATGATYRLTAADLGALVSARVTVSRAGYETTSLTSPTRIRVRVASRFTLDRVRLKHGVRLRLTVSGALVPRADGTVVLRVQGGFRQRVLLQNGVARFTVTGLPAGTRVMKIVYLGSTKNERRERVGSIRIP